MKITLKNEDILQLPKANKRIIPYSYEDYKNTKNALMTKIRRVANENQCNASIQLYNMCIDTNSIAFDDTVVHNINPENYIQIDDAILDKIIIVFKDSRKLYVNFYKLCRNFGVIGSDDKKSIPSDLDICVKASNEFISSINSISHFSLPFIDTTKNGNFAGLYTDIFSGVITKNFPDHIILEFDESNGRNTFTIIKT